MATTKSFAQSKQCLVIRPNATNVAAFIYNDFSNLKNLILFVGSKPSIDEEGKLYFNKKQINDKSVVLRDAYGKVTEVLTFEEAEAKYEILADSDFKPEHANKIIAKVVSTDKVTKDSVMAELKKKGITFNARDSKEALQALLNKK